MTQTILHIDSSARHTGSVTRDLSAQIAAKLGGNVIRRDLAEPLPLLTETWLHANWADADTRSPEQRDILALSDSLIDELRRADTVVIGVPVYNFGVPAALKAWIDLIARAGHTFKYTDAGPQGLLNGKKAIVALASGGMQIGSDADFASSYMRHVLGFVGITDVQLIAADRVMSRGDQALEETAAQIAALAA